MLLFLALRQQEPIAQVLEQDWRQDLVVMLRDRLPRVLIALLVLFVLQRIVLFFIDRIRRLAERHTLDPHRGAQLRTIASTLRAAAYGILGLFAFLQLLTLFNIAYGPLLASAGILGVGVGLGAQSLFKDIINGIFILIEDQFNVGEVVKIAGFQGTVENLTLRSTTLRDGNGTVYHIPNSQVTTVANLSRDYSLATLTVSVDASADPDQVLKLLRDLSSAIRAEDAFRNIVLAEPQVLGITEIRGREILYPIDLRVRANQQDALLRELRRRILLAFERDRIPLGVSAEMVLLAEKTTAALGVPVSGSGP